ncbi:MAG: DUF3006 domain-containing protein [Gemmatimonadota bacterium]|nr:DUF3006 domain-containing protein [Gemmatimonadota bacterium]
MSNAKSTEGKHTWSVDAIEAGVVRVEEDGERMLSVPSGQFPAGLAEGQIFRVTRTLGPDGVPVVHTISVDAKATAAARDASLKQTAQMQAQSRKGDPGGDVNL